MEKALTKYFWIFNLATLAAVAFLLASGSGEMVAASVTELLPQPEQADSKSLRPGRRPRASASSYSKRDGSDILKRNIFDSKVGPIIPTSDDPLETFNAGIGEAGDLPVVPCQSGGVTVQSTVASPQNPDWSFATLTAGGQTDLFRVGDEVDGRTIHDISWRYVFLRGSSDICYVDLFGAEEPGKPKRKRPTVARKDDDIASGIQVDGPNERTVDRSVVDQALANPTKFARSVRVRPYKKNGEVTGFRLRRIKKGSPLELLGAQKGDIIHSVNGVPLTSVDQALAAYQNMRNENTLTFSITRKGRPTDLVINIK
jgi:type II secretion system protein C